MKGKNRSLSGKKPTKQTRAVKKHRGFRKVHIDEEVWEWKYGGGYVKIYSPDGTLSLMGSRQVGFGNWDSDPITPGEVKNWILNNNLGSHKVYPKENRPKKPGVRYNKRKPKFVHVAYKGRLIEIETEKSSASSDLQEKPLSYVVRTVDGRQYKGKQIGPDTKTVKDLSEQLQQEFLQYDTYLILEAITEGVDECFIGCV